MNKHLKVLGEGITSKHTTRAPDSGAIVMGHRHTAHWTTSGRTLWPLSGVEVVVKDRTILVTFSMLLIDFV